MVDERSSTTLSDWPLRPWLLAGIFGLAGLLIHLVTHGDEDTPWRIAVAAFLFFASIAIAFTLEPERWKAPTIFSLVIGLVMAGLAWRAVRYGESLPDEEYGYAAAVLASVLALPLFQAGFLQKRLATPYADIHHHVWTDAISGAAALAFTGLSWIVLALLSELFQLLKIDLLHDLMRQDWFGWTFSGVACGAAFGVLRNQTKILGTLLSVLLLVLSLLAVPLAAGLAIFLLATAVSGPDVLWDATRSATPLLLACAAGAYVLTNAILRDDGEQMSRSRIMRIAALVLAAVILPLAVFAAVSMGLRLGQHGLSPERLWGLVAIVVACAFGVGYWGALLRGRKAGWAPKLRQANFHLGLGICALALLLALPVLDFGAISTRNQLARLESGEVKPADFDYDALRWDFGDAGKKALQELAKGTGESAELATAALERKERPWRGFREDESDRAERLARLRMQPVDSDLRDAVEEWLRGQRWRCDQSCTAIDLGVDEEGKRRVAFVQNRMVEQLRMQPDGKLVVLADRQFAPVQSDEQDDQPHVEVRPWTGRQIYVDGQPAGQPFE